MSPIVSGGGGASSSTIGKELGYDQITASVTIASSTESSGTTVITCAAHTFPGTPVLATFFAPFLQGPSTSGGTAVICLFENTTEIGRLCRMSNPAAAADWNPCVGMLRFTPTVGSHTYTVTAFSSNATGSVGAGAGGTAGDNPAFIRFTQVS